MANDPRLFTVKACPAQVQSQANKASEKKSFLDGILRLGDLEPLNEAGLGDVGEGLRVLASVSDSIRTGQSAVPGREGNETYNTALGRIVGTAADAVSEGANAVIDTVGLGGVAEAVNNINPEVVNRAYGQARNIYDRVKEGNFELTDIPEVFSDLQNLEILGRSIFSGGGSTAPRKEICGATPYAMDLIAYAPKFKFMFVVEFIPAPDYANWAEIANEMAFVVKTSTRPRFDVEYEDVNMYNFRTRVPKRVEYPPMTMSFYDDNKNAAHHFYTAYLRAMSPIANWFASGDTNPNDPQSGRYEQAGMDFSRAPSSATFNANDPKTAGHSASLGPLIGNTTSIIQEIKLYHIFDYGNKMNSYHFYNPRITTFTPSDLSQLETGEGTDFEFEFAYDGMYVRPNIDLEVDNGRLLEITGRHGMRPIDPIYASEAGGGSATSSNSQPSAQDSENSAPTTSFVGEVGNAINGVTDAFGNVIGSIEGGLDDTFGSIYDGVSDAFGGTSLGGFVNGITDGVTGAVGSVIGGATSAIDTVTGGATSPLTSQIDVASNNILTGAGNFTRGLTGGINDAMAAAQKGIGGLGNTVSSAFNSKNSFDGSEYI